MLAAIVSVACGPAAAPAGTQAQPAAPAAAAPLAAPAQPTATAAVRAERMSGAVKSFSGGQAVLADGRSFSVGAATRITRVEPATAADLQPGQYVAVTAKRQPDNTLLASEVRVFPESSRGVAPGQRPMDGGNLMTNATIEKVEGDAFTVTWEGGGAQVKLAPGGKVGRMSPGSQADIREGISVQAQVADGTALFVLVVLP